MPIDILSILENNSLMPIGDDKKNAEGYAEFFSNLKKKIKEAGANQKEIANSLGMSQSWLSKIVNGHRNVDVSDLYRIAHLLGVSPAELLPFNPTEPQPDSKEKIAKQLLNILPADILDSLLKLANKNKKGG
jgi:transcriptional regulator with XRE-family HTH domain